MTNQITTVVDAGTWPSEEHFTGSIVAGLVNAYRVTDKTAYRTAAELGGKRWGLIVAHLTPTQSSRNEPEHLRIFYFES